MNTESVAKEYPQTQSSSESLANHTLKELEEMEDRIRNQIQAIIDKISGPVFGVPDNPTEATKESIQKLNDQLTLVIQEIGKRLRQT